MSGHLCRPPSTSFGRLTRAQARHRRKREGGDLERTNVYYHEATARAAWVKGQYTEAKLIDSALDMVKMMR